MPKTYHYVCPVCNQPFSSNSNKRICCSKKCLAETLKKRTTKQCEQCGKDIIAMPCNLERKRFCSRQCQNTWLGQHQTKEQHVITCATCGVEFVIMGKEGRKRKYCSATCQKQANPVNKIQVICDYCGNVSERFPCRLKDGEKHYCNKKCFYLGNRKEGIHRTLTCKTCGCTYETTIHQIEKRDSKYCSKECSDKGHRTRSGAKSHYWRKIAAEVRKRDGYTCQVCHQRQKNRAFDVHHIIPARLFSNDHLEQANHPHNLITLCNSCHHKIEDQPLNLDFLKLTGLVPGQLPLFVQ